MYAPLSYVCVSLSFSHFAILVRILPRIVLPNNNDTQVGHDRDAEADADEGQELDCGDDDEGDSEQDDCGAVPRGRKRKRTVKNGLDDVEGLWKDLVEGTDIESRSRLEPLHVTLCGPVLKLKLVLDALPQGQVDTAARRCREKCAIKKKTCLCDARKPPAVGQRFNLRAGAAKALVVPRMHAHLNVQLLLLLLLSNFPYQRCAGKRSHNVCLVYRKKNTAHPAQRQYF